MTIQKRFVACITGMPGAGKSTVAEVAQELGFEIFRMGDDVRMEAERRKITPTDENLGMVMLDLRQRDGSAAIAALCKSRIQRSSKSKLVAIDGIRNLDEFFEFKKLGDATLVSVYAPPKKRFELLRARGRSDSPTSWQSFESRDRRELSVGIGEVIAMADDMLSNTGSIGELHQKARELFEKHRKEHNNETVSLD